MYSIRYSRWSDGDPFLYGNVRKSHKKYKKWPREPRLVCLFPFFSEIRPIPNLRPLEMHICNLSSGGAGCHNRPAGYRSHFDLLWERASEHSFDFHRSGTPISLLEQRRVLSELVALCNGHKHVLLAL